MGAEIGDVWRAFSEHASFAAGSSEASGAIQPLQKRFGLALVALYQTGLIVPQPCAGSKTNKDNGAFSGWRLRKRCYGRHILKRKEPENAEDSWMLNSDVRMGDTYENVVEALEPMEKQLGPAAVLLQQIPAWQRNGGLISDAEAYRGTPTAKMEDFQTPQRAAKKQRVRMFMA